MWSRHAATSRDCAALQEPTPGLLLWPVHNNWGFGQYLFASTCCRASRLDQRLSDIARHCPESDVGAGARALQTRDKAGGQQLVNRVTAEGNEHVYQLCHTGMLCWAAGVPAVVMQIAAMSSLHTLHHTSTIPAMHWWCTRSPLS
jgi:hypothetical protein